MNFLTNISLYSLLQSKNPTGRLSITPRSITPHVQRADALARLGYVFIISESF